MARMDSRGSIGDNRIITPDYIKGVSKHNKKLKLWHSEGVTVEPEEISEVGKEKEEVEDQEGVGIKQ